MCRPSGQHRSSIYEARGAHPPLELSGTEACTSEQKTSEGREHRVLAAETPFSSACADSKAELEHGAQCEAYTHLYLGF